MEPPSQPQHAATATSKKKKKSASTNASPAVEVEAEAATTTSKKMNKKRPKPASTALPTPPTKRMRGALPQETPLEEKEIAHRLQVAQKAKRLAFPKYLAGVKNPSSNFAQYGRDHTLGDSDGLIAYHKEKLNRLLDDFILKHQWREAAGVLSVLVRGLPTEEGWKPRNAHQIWAVMEVTRQLEGLEGNDTKFGTMYQFLYDKQPKYRFAHDQTQGGAVRLEQALYLMGQGRYEEAQLATRPLIDVPPYRDHAVANMIHGLILHHQWYELVSQELMRASKGKEYLQYKSERMGLIEGVGENEELINHNKGYEASFIKGNLSSKVDDDTTSECSALPSDCNISEDNAFRPARKCFQKDRKDNLQSFYDDTEEEREKQYLKGAQVICTPDMDRKLFSLCLPRFCRGKNYVVPMETTKVKGAHSNAIKHLQRALSLDTHLTMALLPLVQLMLAGADVKGSYEQIERCCEGSGHSIPFRIKAMLLESLTPRNTDMLSRCYEDTLERDPASMQSINGLINLHQNGEYRTEALLEYIACHLDGSSGSLAVWRKMMSCFKELKEAGEECNKTEDRFCEGFRKETVFDVLNKPLDSILEDYVHKTWSTREIWWPLKHFKIECIDQELKLEGGCKRVVYKAACAAHIFGLSTNYVLEVQKYLRESGGQSDLLKLQEHEENSFNLLSRIKSCKEFKTHKMN